MVPGKRPPPPIWQVSSPVQASPHVQLVSLFATQVPSQQVSPSEPPAPGSGIGLGLMPPPTASQTTPALPQEQRPSMQLGALSPQSIPHPPQLAESPVTSVQVPAQQAWPSVQAAPVPQPQTPLLQLSPSLQRLPISPQLFGSKFRSAQRKVPPSPMTQAWPAGHWRLLPQRHWGGPLLPGCWPQRLARSASQARPQPLQLRKLLSVRASRTPAGALRFTHSVPQQRCELEQLGVHMLVIGPLSVAGPESTMVPVQDPLVQLWPAPQAMPQPPQLPGSVSVLTQRLPQQDWPVVQAGVQEPPTPESTPVPGRSSSPQAAARSAVSANIRSRGRKKVMKRNLRANRPSPTPPTSRPPTERRTGRSDGALRRGRTEFGPQPSGPRRAVSMSSQPG